MNLVILFQTKLEVMSGPVADDGEESTSPLSTSKATSTGESLNGRRREVAAPAGSPEKT